MKKKLIGPIAENQRIMNGVRLVDFKEARLKENQVIFPLPPVLVFTVVVTAAYSSGSGRSPFSYDVSF